MTNPPDPSANQPKPVTVLANRLMLQYAPPERSPRRPLLVIACGIVSTILTLVGVWALNAHAEENIMGWYANGILPIGALLVGVVAGSGYGLVSWLSGVKIRKGLMCIILSLQFVTYFAAQYVEYRVAGGPFRTPSGHIINFPEYFHITAMEFAWIDKTTHKPGKPLGGWGYVFRLLEIVGFAGGGLIVPGVLMKTPYCELCQMYMRQKLLGVIPASVPFRKVKKADAAGQAAYAAEQKAALQQGEACLNRLKQAIDAGDAAAFKQQTAELFAGKKKSDTLPCRIHITLVYCRNCKSGIFKPTMVTGQGKQIQNTPLPTIDLEFQFVQQILS